MKTLIFPLYFVIMLPVEFSVWKEYRKSTLPQSKQSLIKFIYLRS